MDKVKKVYSFIYEIASTLSNNIDENKLKRQSEIVLKWGEKNGYGVIEAPPGFGKSIILYTALKSALHKKSNRNFLFLVPSTDLLSQHTEALKKLGLYDRGIITTFRSCYDQMVNTKSKSKKFDIMVIDEFHNASAETYKECLTLEHKFLIGAKPIGDRADRKTLNVPVVSRISKREADVMEYNMSVRRIVKSIDLDEKSRKEYDTITDKINRFGSIFNNNINTAAKCLKNYTIKNTLDNRLRYRRYIKNTTADKISVDFASVIAETMDTDVDKVKTCAVQFMNNVRKRTKMMKVNSAKIDKTAEILNEITSERKKILVFHGLIETIEQVKEKCIHESVEYNSKLPAKERKHNIRKFKDGEVKIMHSVLSLSEGVDIPEIDTLIIMYGPGSSILQTNRTGRAQRHAEGKNKPVEYHLIFKNTIDEHKYKTRITL